MGENPIADFVDQRCEEEGLITKVDEEYYRTFLQLSVAQMQAIIRALLYETAIWAKNPKNESLRTEAGMCENVEALLDWVALGRGAFLEDGRLTLMKPVGPPPLPQTRRAIDAHLQAARPLILRTLREITVAH